MASGATLEQWVATLRAYLACAYVVSSPTCFVMARPVKHDADPEQIFDVRHCFERPDCWLIHTAAGELREMVKHWPFWLPLVAFHRVGDRRPGPHELRFYQTSRLHQLIDSGRRILAAP